MEKNVSYYFDSHVIKMMLEYAQMLSTINRYCGLNEGYKMAHINHPCTLWVGGSLSNWLYLRDLFYATEKEWIYRRGSYTLGKSTEIVNSLTVPPLLDYGLTAFPLCMPYNYKIKGDTVQSYRNYYIGDKQHLAKWKKRDKPYWYTDTTY